MADIERDRVDSDAAGVGPYARDAERLVPLGDLDGWDIVEGEPDIRGWDVRTVSGREIGSIKELLIDQDAREVVMLDVDLAGSDEHALVPIRVAEVDRDRRIVRVDSADLRRTSAEAAAEGADELPVPPAITPAEVERRAEIVTGKDETTLERENQRDYEEEKRLEASSEQAPLTDYERDRARNREAVAKAERRAEENRVRYGQSKEIVIEQRPVVVEETIVRRRALDGSDAAADETLKRRKDDEIDRPEDRI